MVSENNSLHAPAPSAPYARHSAATADVVPALPVASGARVRTPCAHVSRRGHRRSVTARPRTAIPLMPAVHSLSTAYTVLSYALYAIIPPRPFVIITCIQYYCSSRVPSLQPPLAHTQYYVLCIPDVGHVYIRAGHRPNIFNARIGKTI